MGLKRVTKQETSFTYWIQGACHQQWHHLSAIISVSGTKSIFTIIEKRINFDQFVMRTNEKTIFEKFVQFRVHILENCKRDGYTCFKSL